jgi:hypothetical protein
MKGNFKYSGKLHKKNELKFITLKKVKPDSFLNL